MSRRLAMAVFLIALSACATETIELRGPDASVDAGAADARAADATPPGCVCLLTCTEPRDCGGVGSETCTTDDICEEPAAAACTVAGATCTSINRECRREDAPAELCLE